MIQIQNYDLFIFDFDGTLINTEYFHYEAYIIAISHKINKSIEELKKILTYSIYEQFAHSLNIKDMQNYLYYHFYYPLEDFQELYNYKHKIYLELVEENQDKLKYIDGIEELLSLIIKNKKEFVIVTNSSIKSIKYFLNLTKFNLLKNVKKIYTKEDFLNKKPHPECYLKVLHDFQHLERKIGFEDSLRGLHSLYQLNHSILPVFLNSEKYHFYNYIKSNYTKTYFFYENHNSLEKYHKNIENHDSLSIQNMIQNYMNQIELNKYIMEKAIREISVLIKNKNQCNNIYLTGMGKSGYICKKSASTWQSLSLPCIYLDLPNLPHGDFGLLKENDIIIFISNSGNTEEIVYILKYLREKYHKKVLTISIVANNNSQMEKYSDFTYILNPIIESDHINMTPSTSSCLFMMLLDNIAVYLKKDITKDEFQLNHPAGSLGKK
jgi:D-arabinose 5-phosphate isomerase GutQ/beta-phosphoglucomutase-like phosphatase (HAD superfamily)